MKRKIKRGIAATLALLTLNSAIPAFAAEAMGEATTYSDSYSMYVTNAYRVDEKNRIYRTRIISLGYGIISCSLGPGNGYYIYANLHDGTDADNENKVATERALFSNAGVSESVDFKNNYTASYRDYYYVRARISHMAHTTAGEEKLFIYNASY